jgi:hypothetical protein
MGKKSKQERAKKATKGPERVTGPTQDLFQGTGVPVQYIKFCCGEKNPTSISDRDRDAVIYRWEQDRYTTFGQSYGGEGPAEDEVEFLRRSTETPSSNHHDLSSAATFKLYNFVQHHMFLSKLDMDSWVESEFDGD